MNRESLSQTITERVSMETVLLATMLGAATYMLWESFNFGISQAATFPRLTAGFVFIGTILLLLRPILPEPIYSFVAKDARALDVDEDFKELTSDGESVDEMTDGEESVDETADDEESADETAKPEETTPKSRVGRPLPDAVFTGAAAICYGLAGYVVGLLLVTPVFVAVYGLWFNLSRRTIGMLVVISVVVAFGFVQFLNVPLDQGEVIFTGGWL